MVIVLVGTVAATIAVIAVQLGMFRVTSEVRLTSVETARSTVDVARDQVRASLEQDPLGIYSVVLPQELPRVCIPTDTIIAPGAIWPSECGTTWTYDAASPETTVGTTIAPPSPGNPHLTVSTFARTGTITVGTTDTYQVGSQARPRLYSGTNLDLAGMGTTALDAPAYAFRDITLTGATVEPGAIAAAERAFTGSQATSDDGGNYAGPTYDAGPPVTYSVRAVYPQPMPPSLLRSSLIALHSLACPSVEPYAVSNLTSSLCLKPGGRVREAGGTLVTIPANTTAVLLLPGTGADLAVYTTSASLTAIPGSSCSNGCDLSALPSGATSPGSGTFWGSPLAQVNLPSSGVVGTTVDTFIGLCGSTYATTGACQDRGTTGASAFARSFTVAAGTLSGPVDTYLSGPIAASSAPVGIVASSDIVVPYFAAGAGSDLGINAYLAALGERGDTSALRSLPDTTVSSGRGVLRLNGLLLMADASASTPAYSQRLIRPARDVSNPPPWFPSPALSLERSQTTPMTPSQAAAAFNGT